MQPHIFIRLLFSLVLIHHLEAKSTDNQFHTQLQKEDLQHLFQVESAEQVPEYHVVHLHSRTKRDASGSHTKRVHLKAFGEKKVLNLKPNENLNRHVPVFFADPHDTGTGVKLTPLTHSEDVGVPYQDEASMAAVMIKHHPKTGDLLLDGTIGEDLVVRSVPMSLHGLLPPTTSGGREDEASENALIDDDQLFLDREENLEDDLVFSDGLPLVADDEFVTGASVMPKKESQNKSINTTKEELPEGLLLLRKRRDAPSSGVHIVYKRKADAIDTDFAMMEMDQVPTSSKTKKSRSKREAPYVIYPEILVLVDYDGYLLHGQDNSKIKGYYVSFWNGVDLRYKLLSSPKVKISIAGIIISRSRDAMPYLERNRVGRDAIDSASALTDMGKYLYQERRLPTYDIAVAITKLDMCRRTQKKGSCNRGTAGFAYVGGACVVNKRLQKVNSVAIVEDTGGFSGIIVAAHEVGHLLGAVHDGSPPPSYLGGPGARRCKWKDGYIMSDLRHTERGFRWSPCSIEQFHHFLNGETATCLYNLPHEDESLPRVLPGKLLSLDAQCRKDRGTSACFKDERVCAQLFCFDSSSGFCVSYRPAAEGSPCGNSKICLNGKCTYDNENSIDHDLHSQDDNFLHETKPISQSSSTTTTEPTTTSKSTTTRVPYSTTKRSSWWKHNNRWNKKPISSTTTKPYSPPSTTKKWTTTTSTSTTTSTTTTQSTTTPRKTTIRTTTTRQPITTLKSKPHKSFTTSSPVTEKRTTAITKHNRGTTKHNNYRPTTYRSRVKNEGNNKINSVINEDSNSCEDSISNIAGSLTCQEFLKNYGFRYCNHRYIQKNCCRSKKEMCVDV